MRRTLLWLFVVALIPRVLLSIAHVTYGLPPFISLHAPSLEAIRIINDFEVYYMSQLHYVALGYLPYRDIAYNYPPFFLYTLYPFYIVGGDAAASIPILVSDAATVPFLYLLVRKYSSNGIAWVAALAYALSPFILLYEGYLWLGNQPATFFVILSLFLFHDEKPAVSSIALGLATLFRQEALFILPVYILWSFRGSGRKALRFIIIALTVIALGSAPFLILSPGPYISEVTYLPVAHWVQVFGHPAQTAGNLKNATLTLNLCSPVSRSDSGFIMSCNYGGSSSFVLAPYGSSLLILANNLSFLIRVPLALSVLPALYIARRKKNSISLTSAYATFVPILLFSIFIHQDYRYYYVMVYCLLQASVTRPSGVAVALGSSVLSLLIPEVTIQQLLPPLAILAIILTQEIGDIKITASGEEHFRSLTSPQDGVKQYRSLIWKSHAWALSCPSISMGSTRIRSFGRRCSGSLSQTAKVLVNHICRK